VVFLYVVLFRLTFAVVDFS